MMICVHGRANVRKMFIVDTSRSETCVASHAKNEERKTGNFSEKLFVRDKIIGTA